MSSGVPPKRHKGEGPGGPPPHPDGYGGYPAGGRYPQQPPYGGPGGPPPMGPQSGYNMWQPGQYGNAPPPPPPHSYGHGHPPPGPMYPRGNPPPSMTPDRGGYGSSYPRVAPPMSAPRRPKPPGSAPRPSSKSADAASGPDGPPPPGYQSGGWHPQGGHPQGGHPQGGQWPQHQWGTGQPPSGWQGGAPPPMHHTPNYGNPSAYANSPPRGGPVSRPRGSPDMMGYPQPPLCQPIDNDMDMYHSRGGLDDDNGSATGGNGSSKDKGRGSYKCGRCGVPKKGHVCPYQPKLTRRPGEPLPEMRCAAIQVEMDEFMTMRRLNLKIQGFPESYAAEPYMEDDMVGGEPHPPHPISSATPGIGREMMTVGPDGPDGQPMGLPPQDSVAMLGSPIRSSPIGEDPITGAA